MSRNFGHVMTHVCFGAVNIATVPVSLLVLLWLQPHVADVSTDMAKQKDTLMRWSICWPDTVKFSPYFFA